MFAKAYGSRIKDPNSLISEEEDYDFEERFRKLRIETEETERERNRARPRAQAKPSPTEIPSTEDESEELDDEDALGDGQQTPISKAAELADEEGSGKKPSPRLAALRAGRGRGGKKGTSPARSIPEVEWVVLPILH